MIPVVWSSLFLMFIALLAPSSEMAPVVKVAPLVDYEASVPACDGCQATVNFKVIKLNGWVGVAGAHIPGVTWNSAPSPGTCIVVGAGCAQTKGCSDDATPLYGYNGVGYETHQYPPTNPPAAPATGLQQVASAGLIWLGNWSVDGVTVGCDCG